MVGNLLYALLQSYSPLFDELVVESTKRIFFRDGRDDDAWIVC